ncbi:NAD-dependent epimerase/dehydratase family protein [Neorhodopirellula pilleata]|uniref:GDP-6-deoxy-D-mannose reductase n=1 Tax=Neorhodopirellula pilleata TaxID=2714738 RepID=A0A5C6AIA4_9BACT|nr:NAD(P)-dependent oxidoreductase [Neorhodopirellula pilleata]TWT98905.1 GDP-6-deoxy-D-mannose reductase [Neorhodopirellula pilleata]
MRIALTGATGFVGRRCVDRFLARGWNVRAWYRGANPPDREGVDWIAGELDDTNAAVNLIDDCDHIVHTALTRGGDNFMDEPEDSVAYYQTNVLGTLRLIEAARRRFVSKANANSRFVFLSSGAVHQKVADELPLDERHPLWPATMYGACKASVETLVHAYGFSGKLNAVTLRPVSIVGIDDPITDSKWFDMVRSIAEGKQGDQVDVSGGGKVVYVDDVVSAIEMMMETEQPIAGNTYNLCSGFVTSHQVAMIAKELTGSQVELIGKPKENKTSMRTDKIEALGMRFSNETELKNLVANMIASARR